MNQVEALNPVEQGLLEIMGQGHPSLYSLAIEVIGYYDKLPAESREAVLATSIRWCPIHRLYTEPALKTHSSNTEKAVLPILNAKKSELQLFTAGKLKPLEPEKTVAALIADFAYVEKELAGISTPARAVLLSNAWVWHDAFSTRREQPSDEDAKTSRKEKIDVLLKNPTLAAQFLHLSSDPRLLIDLTAVDQLMRVSDPKLALALLTLIAVGFYERGQSNTLDQLKQEALEEVKARANRWGLIDTAIFLLSRQSE